MLKKLIDCEERQKEKVRSQSLFVDNRDAFHDEKHSLSILDEIAGDKQR